MCKEGYKLNSDLNCMQRDINIENCEVYHINY